MVCGVRGSALCGLRCAACGVRPAVRAEVLARLQHSMHLDLPNPVHPKKWQYILWHIPHISKYILWYIPH